MKPLCIYHGNCADGFGAAWVVRKFFGVDGVEFFAGTYQNAPPRIERGRRVILVDFSYKRDVLVPWMLDNGLDVLLIDHHKSAIEDFTAAPYVMDMSHWTGGPLGWNRYLDNLGQDMCEGAGSLVYTVFDMERSGAGLAWDFFFPNEPRPALIDRIEDRDLWKFKHPDTRAIQAAVFSYPYNFDTWDMLFKADLNVLRTEGEAIERKHHKDVAELVGAFQRFMTIGGHRVPVANLPYTLTSDAGHLMCEPYPGSTCHGDEMITPPFAACYWDTREGRVFSLRSREGGMDVSEIAKQYGGGGHANASGFRVGFDHELATAK